MLSAPARRQILRRAPAQIPGFTSHEILRHTTRLPRSPNATFATQSCRLNAQAKSFTQSNSFQEFQRHESFARRHLGSEEDEHIEMLKALSPPVSSMEEFISQTIPPQVRRKETGLELVEQWDVTESASPLPDNGRSEQFVQEQMTKLGDLNAQTETYIGAGYYGTLVPAVIQRNVLENPAWYTSYTPYQPEISQGRLESLINFQTLVSDLTGLAIANASVLDESTAAAEAMTMALANAPKAGKKTFVVSKDCHPQTLAVLESRAEGFGIELVIGDVLADDSKLIREVEGNVIGALVQYPDTRGGVFEYQALSDLVHERKGLMCVATDLLALTQLKAPGEFGADVALGSAQRFGVPLGYGGPHAGFFACTDKHKRKIPGRIVGVSKDRLGKRAYRLALQTREQHIRREKATSNICTAQALLANMSAMYAIYHGPEGLKAIAEDVRSKTRLAQQLIINKGEFQLSTKGVREDGLVLFDTFALQGSADAIAKVHEKAGLLKINLRRISPTEVGLSLHEGVTLEKLARLLSCFNVTGDEFKAAVEATADTILDSSIPASLQRTTGFLEAPVFNTHHSETELLRYIHHLQSRDLSLVHSMIPLGSCTMKLNATTEMLPVSHPGFSNVHPFAPVEQAPGYQAMIASLSKNLSTITGFDEVSLQPNSGAQGEFAGLRVIKRYHESRGDGEKRNICLIPQSAHGTNPASAAMAGMKVLPIKCDSKTGNLDIADLEAKCEKFPGQIAAFMVTYPSTYGVFEPEVKEMCRIVHQHGGQIYMDGANMNAQIGLCSPGDIGADVCHLNLHKTFCIPHGGGGPGVGPIGVKKHLAPFLPGHPEADPQLGGKERISTAVAPISAAPWGSASILPISHAYILMMGGAGLTKQTGVALLNANYIMSRLLPHYKVVYTNSNGRCAHEFILDIRPFKDTAGVEAADVAKRLQDYGFHAPTMSFPVSGTLMIEPTESESREELDRFCDALIQIRREIADIESGKVAKENNLLKNAPHPQHDLLQSEWDRPYSRESAAYPLPWLREKKMWPAVARVDDAYGDTNLFCTCPPVEASEGLE